jgi:hypothetical protein
MAPPDYIRETPEKEHASGDSQVVIDDNIKSGTTEETGEVFQKPQYRALGW